MQTARSKAELQIQKAKVSFCSIREASLPYTFAVRNA